MRKYFRIIHFCNFIIFAVSFRHLRHSVFSRKPSSIKAYATYNQNCDDEYDYRNLKSRGRTSLALWIAITGHYIVAISYLSSMLTLLIGTCFVCGVQSISLMSNSDHLLLISYLIWVCIARCSRHSHLVLLDIENVIILAHECATH